MRPRVAPAGRAPPRRTPARGSKQVTTIEGLERDGRLHPLQAFVEHGALQCGYCTPGMIMNAYALLLRQPHPTREQIVQAMDDNLCRRGAHVPRWARGSGPRSAPPPRRRARSC